MTDACCGLSAGGVTWVWGIGVLVGRGGFGSGVCCLRVHGVSVVADVLSWVEIWGLSFGVRQPVAIACRVNTSPFVLSA